MASAVPRQKKYYGLIIPQQHEACKGKAAINENIDQFLASDWPEIHRKLPFVAG
ncbi:MAG: hypothetical protein ACFN3F_01145 [Selenomonas sp.]